MLSMVTEKKENYFQQFHRKYSNIIHKIITKMDYCNYRLSKKYVENLIKSWRPLFLSDFEKGKMKEVSETVFNHNMKMFSDYFLQKSSTLLDNFYNTTKSPEYVEKFLLPTIKYILKGSFNEWVETSAMSSPIGQMPYIVQKEQENKSIKLVTMKEPIEVQTRRFNTKLIINSVSDDNKDLEETNKILYDTTKVSLYNEFERDVINNLKKKITPKEIVYTEKLNSQIEKNIDEIIKFAKKYTKSVTSDNIHLLVSPSVSKKIGNSLGKKHIISFLEGDQVIITLRMTEKNTINPMMVVHKNPVMNFGVTIDPETFDPVVSFFNRTAYFHHPEKSEMVKFLVDKEYIDNVNQIMEQDAQNLPEHNDPEGSEDFPDDHNNHKSQSSDPSDA